MVRADSHVNWDQFNKEGPKRPSFFSFDLYHNRKFVLISILRGQPRTPPSGDTLGVLNFHLNVVPTPSYIIVKSIWCHSHLNKPQLGAPDI